MRNKFVTAFVLVLISTCPCYALDNVDAQIPGAEKIGQGRLTYMFWDIYDATLYAANGNLRTDQPLALKLSYLREISGKTIADRSVEEIRRLGFSDEVRLADWHAQMRNIFPDVKKGMSLTGIYTDKKETVFYSNNTEIGRIKDPEFGREFFNIWLSPETSAPDLRRKLLGQQ
jgi:hypothetical protein